MIEGELAVPWSSRLEAVAPPEDRGLARDGVRLLVSRGDALEHHRFRDLPQLLRPSDLLVVNQSGTWPASLPARSERGPFLLNLSTRYAPEVWVAESRFGPAEPGPVPLGLGEQFEAAGLRAERIAPFPGVDRLAFYRFRGDVEAAMRRHGGPIRYGYLARPVPLAEYQTIFARVDGSAEMPSAGRPFTARILESLRARGIRWVPITLHAGVSSLERGDAPSDRQLTYPEPFEVPAETVQRIERTRRTGGRVIAVGTTVVRALESATGPGGLRAARGFTQAFLHPGRPMRTADGLVTGLHDRGSSHLSLLAALAPAASLERAYRAAVAEGYAWHEFGDSHLILPS